MQTIQDLENVVVKMVDDTPIYLKHLATVKLGPALRRGVLDKGGVETVGGVVVARYGENPQKVITALKKKISDIAPHLPRKTLADGSTSQVRIVPFYDRSLLIEQTLDTLKNTLRDEMLITTIVVMVLLMQVGVSVLVSMMLPLGLLLVFALMKTTAVDSHIMSLAGIAIAIGTIVDMGIIVSENIYHKIKLLKSRDGMLW